MKFDEKLNGSGGLINNYALQQVMNVPDSFDGLDQKHGLITQQHSSSTDEGCEGCDTDHGGECENILNSFKTSVNIYFSLVIEMDETPTTVAIHRLNSFASQSFSSGNGFTNKGLSQNLSCDSSRSNFSAYESVDLNSSECSDIASSLLSCVSENLQDGDSRDANKRKLLLW